jgi:hypothetical protein
MLKRIYNKTRHDKSEFLKSRFMVKMDFFVKNDKKIHVDFESKDKENDFVSEKIAL